MAVALVGLAFLVPLVPLLAGLAARGPVARVRHLIIGGCIFSLAAAALATVGLICTGSTVVTVWPAARLGLSLRLDAVAAVGAVLVSFIGTSVLRFSAGYLQGDPRQAVFMRRLSLTLAATLALMLSNHLLVLLASWVAMSVGVHGLLLHFPGRVAAVRAARTKFVFSRLAEICLVAALVLVYRGYGTFEIDALFTKVEDGVIAPLPPVAWLLVACAMLKSAQFPFHSWLPDTMETPTPVSAFMHAGIVNAGGFLLIRLSPLMIHVPHALDALTLVGSCTAAFAATVMLTQTSVKRALAYSTIAQMGFMLLECGLGAFGLALIHLVAHSLYKSHAFLYAGSSIGTPSRVAIPLKNWAIVVGCLVGAAVKIGVHSLAARMSWPDTTPGVLQWVVPLALAYAVARVASSTLGVQFAGLMLLTALGAGLGMVAIPYLAQWLVPIERLQPAPLAVQILVGATFAALFAAQLLVWRAGHYALGRALYVHALNGFYIGLYTQRALRAWQPRPLIHPAPSRIAKPFSVVKESA